jgi:DNA-3-methyladenine glycosylase
MYYIECRCIAIIMQKIPLFFYQRKNVLIIGRQLLGKLLCTYIDGYETIGRIVETEAYNGVLDKASHAYGGRRTTRTQILYEPGGIAYVYLCYGIHYLFNVVTNIQNIPEAVLIRAVEPVVGIDIMLQRMKKQQADHSIGRGPGNVSKALGINNDHTGISLTRETIYITDDNNRISPSRIVRTPRIGVDYAGKDALLPYRFIDRKSNYISGKK